MIQPDYIFETSWEVCNRVGGIYAVLSTRAASMLKEHPDKVIFFGPDLKSRSDLFFREDPSLLADWKAQLAGTGHVRTGHWEIPGRPIAVLVDYSHLWPMKDRIYGWAWNLYGVQSHAAYGDYDDSSLFGYAVGEVAENLYRYLTAKEPAAVCFQANEWQTAFSIFYLKAHCPQIATVFTTHATGIGRSIAGNGKPLYDYFGGYHGDQMAQELNMVSKHSAEKQAAHACDCFTTVSDLTAKECAQLLDKPVDIVTPNGFEPDFVPRGRLFNAKRHEARQALAQVAEKYVAVPNVQETLFICIAGRLEWKNKGIDVFLQAMDRLDERLQAQASSRQVVAFVMIPYLEKPYIVKNNVTVLFVPYYLDGADPLFGRTYYDLLIGMDATVFPSYYEPWGYTPLESAAFHVPTVTTTLAGFGLWAQQQTDTTSDLSKGICVIPRTDSNYDRVVNQIADVLADYAVYSSDRVLAARQAAAGLAKKAEWKHFFPFYRRAYAIALKKAAAR